MSNGSLSPNIVTLEFSRTTTLLFSKEISISISVAAASYVPLSMNSPMVALESEPALLTVKSSLIIYLPGSTKPVPPTAKNPPSLPAVSYL